MVYYQQAAPFAPRGRGYGFGRGAGNGTTHHNYAYQPYGRGRGENVPPSRPKSAQKADMPKARFEVDGVTFQLCQNGSKLKRITPADDKLPTPMKHEIAGIKFFRTKGGNLLRHKEYLELQEKKEKAVDRKKQPLCPKFTHTGFCNGNCNLNHDPKKLAACKSFLHTGNCQAPSCLLSHDLTPHRTPICRHFARGRCTNSRCRYTHASPKESELVCEDFAYIGYCESGGECPNLHVFECPDYVNKGVCNADPCFLPHVDDARRMRRLTGNGSSTEPASNDHSDAEHEDTPSDDANVGFYVDLGGDKATSPVAAEVADASQSAFSKQEDFIRL